MAGIPRQAATRSSVSALAALLLLLGGSFLGGCSADDASEEPPADAAAASPGSSAASADSAAARTQPPTRTDGDRSVAQRVEDASLAARVKMTLTENRQLRTFDFEPRVTDGRVTLAGDVGTRALGETAADVASEVDGVDDVLNRVTVEGQQTAWAEPETEPEETQDAAASEDSPALADASSPRAPSPSGTAEVQGGGDASASASPSEDAAASSDGGAGNGSGEEAAEYYVVKSGESLWSIARKNDLTVDRLKELNGLSGNNLMPGDRLRVE